MRGWWWWLVTLHTLFYAPIFEFCTSKQWRFSLNVDLTLPFLLPSNHFKEKWAEVQTKVHQNCNDSNISSSNAHPPPNFLHQLIYTASWSCKLYNETQANPISVDHLDHWNWILLFYVEGNFLLQMSAVVMIKILN